MKRRLLIVTVFLLAGAVVNVAVAWGWSRGLRGNVFLPSDSTLTTDQSAALWRRNAPTGWRIPPPMVYGWRSRGVAAIHVFISDDPGGIPLNARVLSIYQTGLPLRCLSHVSIRPTIAQETYRLIWSGFAVNTILYAGILWLLIGGPFVRRRLIRVKRGLCPACAYPRGESEVCVECGKLLPGRAKVTA